MGALGSRAGISRDLPQSLTWFWRGYNPAKTAQEFRMDPAKKDKPFFRVAIIKRDAWQAVFNRP